MRVEYKEAFIGFRVDIIICPEEIEKIQRVEMQWEEHFTEKRTTKCYLTLSNFQQRACE